MKRVTLLLFLSLFINSQSYAAKPDFIVAKVNNKAITNSELNDRYNFVIYVAKIAIKSAQDKEMLSNQILDKMIDEELIRQRAASLKMEVSPEEIREAIDDIALHQKKNATQLKISIINHGLSFDNYLKQVESEVLWSKIISETLRARVKVTEGEVNEFFEQQKFNTNVKKFHIAEIFIPKSTTAAQLASKLVLELRQGADFENIVRQFSRGLSAESNGDIGWVSHNEVDPRIYNELVKVPKLGYSNPILLAEGYHIFKIIDAKIESKIADKDMTEARNILFSRKLQTLAKGYLMDLRKEAFVEVSR